MLKTLGIFFLTSFLFVWNILNISPAFAEEDTEYRFERLWPRLEQPWYFDQPTDVDTAADGSVYVVVKVIAFYISAQRGSSFDSGAASAPISGNLILMVLIYLVVILLLLQTAEYKWGQILILLT